MPELPEVETVRRGLLATIIGEMISAVEVHRLQTVAYPEAKQFASTLPGYKIIDLSRRGKYLLLHLKKKHNQRALLVVHLRMSGRLLLMDKKNAENHTKRFLRLQITLASGKELLFEDMRVFGRFWFVEQEKQLFSVVPSLAGLGPEPLPGISARQLKKILHGQRQPIKAALLNQNLLAGIGNIYADEILFEAGIHPFTKAGQLTLRQNTALSKVIPVVLERAIALGGSSVKDFKDSSGVNGNYQHSAFVYGRAGKPCRNCGMLIEKARIIGRSAHFCPKCQIFN